MFRLAVTTTAAVVAMGAMPSAWADDRDSVRWAGYTSEVEEGSFNTVSARWAVPAIQCQAGEDDAELAVWIGLDGVGNPLVEQVGTTSECNGDAEGTPNYFAWAEAYPDPAVRLFQVQPGDLISAEVEVEDGRFRFTLRDITRLREESDDWATEGVGRSAEAVVEAPPGKRLPAFAPIQLTRVEVDSDPIGELEPDRVTLVRAGQPRVVRAEPGALTANGTSFTVQFHNH